MVIEQYTTFMGFECVLEFEVVVNTYGVPEGRYSYECSPPEWYVDECHMYIDPAEKVGGPLMEVTGEMLDVLTEKFSDKIEQDFMERAAEDYWTEKWSGEY